MRAVIFANGDIPDLEAARAQLQPTDLLLAADGGGRHCLALGLTPAAVIGDMDSLSEIELAQLQASGAEILRHSPRKDETDLELALLHARDHRADHALVLGGLGSRWDMSIANLLLAAYDKLTGLEVTYWQAGQRLFLIRGEAKLPGQPGATVSLIPLAGPAHGITTTGLEYPLNSETLPFGSTRGLSNVLHASPARVTLTAGLLLCVIDESHPRH